MEEVGTVNKSVGVNVNIIFMSNEFDNVNLIFKVERVEGDGCEAANHGEEGSGIVRVRM